MGSVLSAAHAALCSFVEAQFDKAEARRLMAIYPGLRDMPADELDVHLRRLIDEKKREQNNIPMSKPLRTALLAAATVIAALCALPSANATVIETCQAAATSDRRVNYDFCVSELGKHRDSPDADVWGLAKVAANVGVNGAGGAINEIVALLGARDTDTRTRAALKSCEKLYYDMELAFAGAYDEINARNYTAGKQMAGDAAALVNQCDGGFAEAGLPPPEPVARRGAFAVQIAIVCTAITNLIRP